MTGLLWNLLLALAWAAVTGDFSEHNLALGFGLGFVVLAVTRRTAGGTYVSRVGRALDLVLYFVWELVLANLRVAWDVLTPSHRARPAVLAIPLDAKTDVEITLLANLITLTPGTVTLDLSQNRRTLYVHAMYADAENIDAFRQRIKDGFERRVLRVLQ